MPHTYPLLNVEIRRDDIQLTGVEACWPVLGLGRPG
jgi:hypothetical protein